MLPLWRGFGAQFGAIAKPLWCRIDSHFGANIGELFGARPLRFSQEPSDSGVKETNFAETSGPTAKLFVALCVCRHFVAVYFALRRTSVQACAISKHAYDF